MNVATFLAAAVAAHEQAESHPDKGQLIALIDHLDRLYAANIDLINAALGGEVETDPNADPQPNTGDGGDNGDPQREGGGGDTGAGDGNVGDG